MHINLNYTYIQEQLKKAHRFDIFPTKKSKLFFGFITFFVFSVTAFFLLFEPAKLPNNLLIVFKIILMICSIFWLLMVIIVTLNYFLTPIFLFKKSPYHRGNFIVTLTDESMICKQEIMGENTKTENEGIVHWKDFDKKSENDEFIFLYPKRKNCILPKESFQTKSELEEFRNFLTSQTHIKSKKFNGKELWG